jgi:hypothetical protein
MAAMLTATLAGAQMHTLYVTEKSGTETILAEVGSQVDVKLSGLQWTPIKATGEDDPAPVLKRLTVRGESHFLYAALRAGTVTLSSHGRAHCQPGQMCPQFVIAWSTTVTVVEAHKN